MESFFGQLKTECFYGWEFYRLLEIDGKGSFGLLQSSTGSLKLQGLSPIQYRHQSLCK